MVCELDFLWFLCCVEYRSWLGGRNEKADRQLEMCIMFRKFVSVRKVTE